MKTWGKPMGNHVEKRSINSHELCIVLGLFFTNCGIFCGLLWESVEDMVNNLNYPQRHVESGENIPHEAHRYSCFRYAMFPHVSTFPQYLQIPLFLLYFFQHDMKEHPWSDPTTCARPCLYASMALIIQACMFACFKIKHSVNTCPVFHILIHSFYLLILIKQHAKQVWHAVRSI